MTTGNPGLRLLRHSRLLLDGSPAGEWCEQRLLEGLLAGPHFLLTEIAEVVRRAEARGLVDGTTARQALADLPRLDVKLVPFALVHNRASELMSTVGGHDAAYAATAELLGARLVDDRPVARRCPRSPLPGRGATDLGIRQPAVVDRWV